ncbi:hypothetical protein K490DRAFT_33011 [Saccharata proteae CBS 121410]|uniref:Emopamil-binding protein n=1 Tax=Saccharata proteae CBS 121410 TaxID=1314787 RepID=A0A9P4I1R6_9PEZI|nr:hypothetical protein K490DRAFT_33011 [Saccharata proteae CBS 121410]
MVSTRSHPSAFPPPDLTSPTKPTKESPTKRASSATSRWSHTPSNLTLVWLAISLPLVIWDTGYVMLRPHSMPGGALHWPIWQPYELYGTVDYVYGWPAWNAHNGFTAAQGSLNIVETVMYLYYAAMVWKFGRQRAVEGTGAPTKEKVGWLGESRTIGGSVAGKAVLVGFAAAVMTLSKTVLYWLNEYFSGFENIGHNSFSRLLFLWIIPNGAWLAVPSYMIYVFGQEILQGLDAAAGVPPAKKND